MPDTAVPASAHTARKPHGLPLFVKVLLWVIGSLIAIVAIALVVLLN